MKKKLLIDDTGIVVGYTNQGKTIVPESTIQRIKSTENPNVLWEIAQELNRDKFLSNKALSNISHDLTKIKARRNIKAFERVRQIILKASTEA